MIYKVEWVENKSTDWKIVTLTGVDGTVIENASVNRTNKKGEVFPNFDGITPGTEITGEPWQSDKGKWYFFAPKITKNNPTWARKPQANIAAAMDKKAENIAQAQGVKNEAIMKAGAQRDAVLIVTTFFKDSEFPLTPAEIQEKVEYWFKYFLNRSEQPF